MDGTDQDEVLELETGDIAGGGGCVARAPDGRVVFVRHALPGERVMAQITSSTTSFLRADAIEILEASADRVSPPCVFAGPGRCGGCDFQHVNVAAQRKLKATRIADQLQRVAGLDRTVEVEAVEGGADGLGWRTRTRLAVDDEGNVAFRRHRSHELEYVDSCAISHPDVMATGTFRARWSGASEVEVVVTPESAEAIVTMYAVPKSRPRMPDVRAGVIHNGRVLHGPGAVHATVLDKTFEVSPGVFWQVHVGAAKALVLAVREVLAAQPGDDVVDLYAGAGLFSVFLAEDVGHKGSVLAVERDRRACADNEFNGQRYGQLTVKKATVTKNLVEKGIGSPTLLVLDPAREGAGKEVMTAIDSHASTLRRVVYVSCDPASFSRDVRVLLNTGWTLSSLRAFDIFPMTEHVELVAALEPSA
jgi:tRNA/tmRNA/rRNA uracil-C5-methylase (TrmA/RlmC/RlmD family)